MENNKEHTEEKSTRYQYSYVDMETVISNPDEYIIPACQPACQSLWDKNIETFMVSNNDDDHLYVLLGSLDDMNKRNIEEAMKYDSRFFYSKYRNTYGIKVHAGMEDANASKELEELTDIFVMQDTVRFTTPEQFLADYKTAGSKAYEVLEDGTIHIKENTELAEATFEEALENTGKRALYIEDEGRVYKSPMYLMWHQRYKEYTKNMESNYSQGRSR